MKQKTSLERSHSAFSNTKLTFVAFLAALLFAAVFAGLGIYADNGNPIILYAALGAGGLDFLFFVLLLCFRR